MNYHVHKKQEKVLACKQTNVEIHACQNVQKTQYLNRLKDSISYIHLYQVTNCLKVFLPIFL